MAWHAHRAEATDVANVVLDGMDGILLGAESVRGRYPLETVQARGIKQTMYFIPLGASDSL